MQISSRKVDETRDQDGNNDHHNNNVGYINSKLHSNYEALGSDATNLSFAFLSFQGTEIESQDMAPDSVPYN